MLDLPNWAPTIKQVAARLMARTKMPNGDIGSFNDETTPTAEQVNEVIAQAVAFMRPRLGPVPDSLVEQAQALATLRVSYMVELGYFPEQTETSISPYRSLLMEYKEELENWDIAAAGLEPNSPTLIHSVKVMTDYPSYTTPYPTEGTY
jgi:hypothetical protein